MTRRRLLIAGWLVVLGLSALLPLSAVFHGVVHTGPGPYVIARRGTQPIIALGSDVILPHGTNSIVVAILGNIDVRGNARDDLVAVGGRIYLGRKIHVSGDVLSVMGAIYRGPGVTASGRLGGALHAWRGESRIHGHDYVSALGNATRLGLAAGLALFLAGICLTIIFPWQIVLISSTLRTAPIKSGAAGLLCVITFAFLVIPLGLSLAGLPFALLLTGAASLAWLFGLTAAAVVVGRLLARSAVSLLWATAAGLVILAIGMGVPVLGPLLVVAVGLAGAGALAVALLGRSHPSTPIA